MSYAEVQTKNILNNSGTTLTVTATSAGNFLVAYSTVTGPATDPTATISSTGTTWTKIGSSIEGTSGSASGRFWLTVWVAINAPSITSVTFGNSTGTFGDGVFFEFSGIPNTPTAHGNGNNSAANSSASPTVVPTSTGASGDFGFVCVGARTTAGAAGNSVTAIADTNSNSWHGTSGVDVNLSGAARVASSWATLSAAIGTVTFTESGTKGFAAIAFAYTPGSGSPHLLACCGGGI